VDRAQRSETHLRSKRPASEHHRVRRFGMAKPRSDLWPSEPCPHTRRHQQPATSRYELGHTVRTELRPPQSEYKYGRSILGRFDRQRNRQQRLLVEYRDHNHLGRLGRMVRPRSSAHSHSRWHKLGIGIRLRFSRSFDRGLAVCQTQPHLSCDARFWQHPELRRRGLRSAFVRLCGCPCGQSIRLLRFQPGTSPLSIDSSALKRGTLSQRPHSAHRAG
jgi:hypothetical protein